MKNETKLIISGSLKGHKIKIEDTWINVYGESWMFARGNPACLQYAIRAAADNLPTDDNVYYGKINSEGHLVHESELGEVECANKTQ